MYRTAVAYLGGEAAALQRLKRLRPVEYLPEAGETHEPKQGIRGAVRLACRVSTAACVHGDKSAEKKKLHGDARIFSVPIGSLAVCFMAFMLLVNLLPPFARACRRCTGAAGAGKGGGVVVVPLRRIG